VQTMEKAKWKSYLLQLALLSRVFKRSQTLE
jgi:hypothetical protein